jgi:hypothetical protein
VRCVSSLACIFIDLVWVANMGYFNGITAVLLSNSLLKSSGIFAIAYPPVLYYFRLQIHFHEKFAADLLPHAECCLAFFTG